MINRYQKEKKKNGKHTRHKTLEFRTKKSVNYGFYYLDQKTYRKIYANKVD